MSDAEIEVLADLKRKHPKAVDALVAAIVEIATVSAERDAWKKCCTEMSETYRRNEIHGLSNALAGFDRLSHAAAQLSGTDRDAPGKPTGKQPPRENYCRHKILKGHCPDCDDYPDPSHEILQQQAEGEQAEFERLK